MDMCERFYTCIRYCRNTFKVLEKIDKTNRSKILNCGYGKGLSVKQVDKEFKKYTNIKILKYNAKKKR